MLARELSGVLNGVNPNENKKSPDGPGFLLGITLRRYFRVSSEMPTAYAFCRTAPSDRRRVRPMRRAGVLLRAIDLSWRMSAFDQSRRIRLLVAAISLISVGDV